MDEVTLNYRDADPKRDFPFIIDSWGGSYQQGSNGRHLSHDEFGSFHKPIREKILIHPDVKVKICYPNEDVWLIIGWIVYQVLTQNMAIHYVYVKNAFRFYGIGRGLLSKINSPSDRLVFITHRTFKAAKIMDAHPDEFHNYTFTPHLV